MSKKKCKHEYKLLQRYVDPDVTKEEFLFYCIFCLKTEWLSTSRKT